MSEAPFQLERWYTALVAATRRLHVLGAEEPLTVQDVRAAWSRVRAGEALVLSDRPRGLRPRLARLGRTGLAERLARSLPEQGRRDRWLALPGTGGSHTLLPASPRGFTSSVRLLPAGRRRWRIARHVLTCLGRWRVVDRLGLDEVIVVVKGRTDGGAIRWLDDIHRPTLGVALGVPGSLRKAVVLAADLRGEPQAILKLSLEKASREQVRHEADVLEHLLQLAPESTFGPALYGRGETEDGTSWLAQEVLEGARSGDEIRAGHTSFLAALHWRTHHDVPFEELALFREASKRLERLRRRVGGEWLEATTRLRDALERRLTGETVTCALAHGDFTPWNVVCDEGHVRAFDWEFERPDAPALFDLVHFSVQTGVLVRRFSAERILDDLAAFLEGPGGSGLLQNAGIGLRDVSYLVGLYVFHVLTFEAELHLDRRPDFPQVDWLYRGRIDLARLLEPRLTGEARARLQPPAA